MQPTRNLKAASRALLTTLLKKFGGYAEIARAIGVDRQLIYMMQSNGYITLNNVYLVSKALQLDPWALSYVKLYQVFGEDSKDFEQVVKGTGVLDNDEINNIMKVYRQ